MADFPDCPVTNSPSDLVLPYGYIEGSEKFRSFVRITGSTAYTPICGVVVSVEIDEVDDKCYMVTIQYSAKISIRIGHLETVAVWVGEPLVEGMFVGSAFRNEIDFYYITTDENLLTRPVYVSIMKLYPQEPTLVLNNLVNFEQALVYQDNAITYLNKLNEEELTNGKGEAGS